MISTTILQLKTYKQKQINKIKFISKVLAFQIKPSIQHLILHVTSKCNLNCKTCFVKKDEVDLPLKNIRQIGKTLNRITWLDIGGGEPFIRDDLPEICKMFNANDITIPTNGTNPERIETIVQKIQANYKQRLTIAVSLDGFKDINDEIRGKGSFKNAIETVKRLTAIKGITTKINTVICQRNFSKLLPFMEFVHSFGVKYHSLLLLRGQPMDKNYTLPPIEDLYEVTDKIFAILGKYDYHKKYFQNKIMRNYQSLLWKLSLQALTEKRQPIPCLAGNAHLVIYANGDVAPCELLPPIGNLLKTPLETIIHSKAMASDRKRIQQDLCYCTHNCNMVENILFNFSTYPSLLGVTTLWLNQE